MTDEPLNTPADELLKVSVFSFTANERCNNNVMFKSNIVALMLVGHMTMNLI